MASPQTENGFTKIANELMEAILKSNLTLREMKVVLTVIRFSYGFNRKEAELSVRFISNATGIKYQHISGSISSLIDKGILIITESEKHKQGRKIKLNKDYELWNFQSSQKSDSSQKGDGSVPKTVTVRVPKRVTKKENNKEKIKKNRILYSIENISENLNGQLYYKNDFFYVTVDLKNELLKNIPGLKEEELKTNFYKMKVWLEHNGRKKDYKRFIVHWLSQNDYSKKDKGGSSLYEDF